jgi:hypothetical protein
MPLADLIDAEEVRRSLDPLADWLDAESLPDPVVDRQVFAGRAIAEVVARVPDADAIATGADGAAKQHVKNALNLLTASFIAPSLSQTTREQLTPGVVLSREKIDLNRLSEDLRQHATSEIAALLKVESRGYVVPPLFGVARGNRSRC